MGWSGGAKSISQFDIFSFSGGVLLIWIIVGHGPSVLAVGASGGIWIFLSRLSFSFLSPSLEDGSI